MPAVGGIAPLGLDAMFHAPKLRPVVGAQGTVEGEGMEDVGQVLADGPTKVLFANEALMQEAGLELPLSLQCCPVCGCAKQ